MISFRRWSFVAHMLILLCYESQAHQHQQEHARHNLSHLRRVEGWYSNPNPHRSILVDSRDFNAPPGYGGVEALIQLSIALSEAAQNSSEVHIGGEAATLNTNYLETYRKSYGPRLVHRSKLVSSLKPGDIYIVSESLACPNGVPRGVHVFVYLLSNAVVCTAYMHMNTTSNSGGINTGTFTVGSTSSTNSSSNSSSIQYLSHNHYLGGFATLRLPRERVLHPYINEAIARHAVATAGLQPDGSILPRSSHLLRAKKNLVLIDNDVPLHVRKAVQASATRLGGQSLLLNRLSVAQIMGAYEHAKAVIDWDMRGSERCPLEAALFGAAVLTNARETGGDFVDFPLPPEGILAAALEGAALHAALDKALGAVFSDYWSSAVPRYEALRRTILSHSASALARDCVHFLSSVEGVAGFFGGDINATFRTL